MLEQNDAETIDETIVVVANFLSKERAQALAEKLSNIAQGSVGEYKPLAERLAEFVKEPDKSAGFILVGNDTWLPKRLVNDRKCQQRRVSRMAETGIVWTR